MAHLSGHLVICNWTARSEELLAQLHSPVLAEDEDSWMTVVVISRDVGRFPDSAMYEDTFLIPSSPLERNALLRANVQDAHSVIILPDPAADNPDDRTLRCALEILAIRQDSSVKRVDETGPRVVAEVLDPNNARQFRQSRFTGIHEVVCDADLGLRTLAQANLQPGVTHLLADLLDHSPDRNDIYSVRVEPGCLLLSGGGLPFSRLCEISQRVLADGTGGPALLLGVMRPSDQGDRLFLNPGRRDCDDGGRLQLEAQDRLVLLARNPSHAKAAGQAMGARAAGPPALEAGA